MLKFRRTFLVFLFLASSTVGFSQRPAEVPEGFSFEKPTNWFEGDIAVRAANLKRFTFDRDDMAKLLANEKSSGIVAIFYKDDPKRTPGIIPTIQVILRPKSAKMSFDQFKGAVSNPKPFEAFEDFAFSGAATAIDISGVRSVMLNATFKLRREDRVYSIRSRTYAIPRTDYFIQISMSDEDDEGWTEEEFADFISSVRISN